MNFLIPENVTDCPRFGVDKRCKRIEKVQDRKKRINGKLLLMLMSLFGIHSNDIPVNVVPAPVAQLPSSNVPSSNVKVMDIDN